MNTKFTIYNEFGILPSKNYEAAGYDFYIPNIKNVSEEEHNKIIRYFSESYKCSVEKIVDIFKILRLHVSDKDEKGWNENTALNILHLFLSVSSNFLTDEGTLENVDTETIYGDVDDFVRDYLVFKEDGTPGLKPSSGMYVLFNSGIRTYVGEGRVGIFMNKSGRATKGWDVRAQVVDEDYTGLVHLSAEFYRWNSTMGTIYCGDKFLQMILLNIPKTDIIEVDKTEFDNLHNDSKRGTDGFGSSDNR